MILSKKYESLLLEKVMNDLFYLSIRLELALLECLLQWPQRERLRLYAGWSSTSQCTCCTLVLTVFPMLRHELWCKKVITWVRFPGCLFLMAVWRHSIVSLYCWLLMDILSSLNSSSRCPWALNSFNMDACRCIHYMFVFFYFESSIMKSSGKKPTQNTSILK
jgi:hypothetical protein